MHPFFNIFGKDMPAYGIMMIIGGLSAFGIVTLLSKLKKGYTDVTNIYLIGIGGGIAGSAVIRPIMKIIEIAIRWDEYKSVSIGDAAAYVFGELVFMGGLFGGLITIYLFCKAFKKKIIPVLDLFAPALAFGHSIGRIGCLLGGCCYGAEVLPSNPFVIIYPDVSLSAPSGVPLFAAPLVESVFLVFLTVLLTILFLKSSIKGLCVSAYCLLYATERFILEFYRGDTKRGKYGFLTTSQYLCLALFVIGAVMLYISFTGWKNRDRIGVNPVF